MIQSYVPEQLLPSQTTALALSEGAPVGVLLARDIAGRAALISLGMYCAGLRGKELWRGALGGALSIEAFVLAWTLYHRNQAGNLAAKAQVG